MNKKSNHRFGVEIVIFGFFAVVFIFGCFLIIGSVPTLASRIMSSIPPRIVFQPNLPQSPGFDCIGDDCVNACLSKLSGFLPVDTASVYFPQSAFKNLSNTKMTPLVSYYVKGDFLSAPQFSPDVPSNYLKLQKDVNLQETTWNYFAAMIPPNRRQGMSKYVINTDGAGNIAARAEINYQTYFIYPPNPSAPPIWTLQIDIIDVRDPGSLSLILLHEFGHVLTLNTSQIMPDPKVLTPHVDIKTFQEQAATCPQYFSEDGCSRPGSYLNKFFDEFWSKIYDDWKKVDAQKDQDTYSSMLAEFYSNHSSQFNTRYSATSPIEDIAESWAYFVLESKPASVTIAHQKVLFFYKFPELVDLRNQIIYRICKYAYHGIAPIE